MIVERISFKEFRNLKNAEVVPSKGVNVICGDNAQGKTNFLEAIWRTERELNDGGFFFRQESKLKN